MSERRARAAFGGVLLLAASSAAVEPGCLERRDDEALPDEAARCATCHGDPAREGDYLRRSAPPADLLGAASPEYPGVGAHAIHLDASATHAAFACSECHVVPDRTETPGHADDARPAEVVFGELARLGGRAPRYDAVARRCSDSYCHGAAGAVWTEPRDSERACGSCHGLPPPAPHPQSERCDACHAAVVNAERRIVAPALHVDGKVDVADGACTACHGSGEDPAPPRDTLGNTAVSAIGVGAHRAHLGGGNLGRPLACSECHAVPVRADEPGHADALPAEVLLSGIARTGARQAVWDRASATCANTFCHGPSPASSATSPSWTQAGSLDCTGCHGAPPAPPHPQLADCSRCHGAVVASDDVTIASRDRHVDGKVDVLIDGGCTSCHGAPPDAGAHQAHVLGSARARAVPCAECHRVPDVLLAPGHVDTGPPAELVFSGAALAFGAAPRYANGSCEATPCHGAVSPNPRGSGGSNMVPAWTVVDGSQAACGTCHGLPPPAPHPRADLNPVCSSCHENVAADNRTFVRPELHVDGVVTFVLP